jgi:membrane dipeptidase
MHQALREFDVALRMIESQPGFEQARTAADIRRLQASGKIACLIGVEGGHMIENSLAALRIYFNLGARYMTLTHWDNIDWADASTDRVDHYGLTEFGISVIHEMNRLGMFVDLSHVSPDTMRDALHVSRAPLIFSHSNAYAVSAHPRSVPDDVLKMLAANGGVVHVNFIKAFVAPESAAWQAQYDAAVRAIHARLYTDKAVQEAIADWRKANPQPRGTIRDVADHIDHIRKVAGIDHIGIGSDFYDIAPDSMAVGLENVTTYPYLFAELLRRNYNDEDILKIAGRNHLRAMEEMEKVATRLRQTENPIINKE